MKHPSSNDKHCGRHIKGGGQHRHRPTHMPKRVPLTPHSTHLLTKPIRFLFSQYHYTTYNCIRWRRWDASRRRSLLGKSRWRTTPLRGRTPMPRRRAPTPTREEEAGGRDTMGRGRGRACRRRIHIITRRRLRLRRPPPRRTRRTGTKTGTASRAKRSGARRRRRSASGSRSSGSA